MLENVHVGIQIRYEPTGLQPGDVSAKWSVDVQTVVDSKGAIDFRGPAVHGKRGDRFLYLSWGNVETDGRFERFSRAKLMLNRIDSNLPKRADRNGSTLRALVRLSDEHGRPRCARVDPPAIEWTVEPEENS